jgi:hypothetical protein
MIKGQKLDYGVEGMIGSRKRPKGLFGRISGGQCTFLENFSLIFRRFLWDKERELWDTFQDLDKNGDGRLDAVEMRAALSRSGIDINPATVEDLVRHLAHGAWTLPKKDTLSQEDMYITFGEFRDFLIMMPRRATPLEIYKCKSSSSDFLTSRLPSGYTI